MNYQEALKKTEDYVNLYYSEHAQADLFYHNQSNMKELVDNAKKMAYHYQLDDRLFFIVSAAAFFHDMGHLIKNESAYELKSAGLAETFLTSIGADKEDVEAIKKCITATIMPQKPDTLSEKIICDVDTFYFGSSYFKEKTKSLKKESEAAGKGKIDGVVWRATIISTLEGHQYYTDYCQLLLDKTKAENLDGLKNRQEEKLNKANPDDVLTETPDELKAAVSVDDGKVPKVKKKDKPVRGIETMFRISSSNNVRVSAMADNKAHIMISVNSIIISVVLGLVIKNLDENQQLIVPTMMLLAVNISTIIYAVLATRPKATTGVFTKEQVEKKSVNLLFYGSFYNMNFKEYDEGIRAMMSDSEFLYGSLTKDIFWQGKVLGRKFRLLRISYTIFLYGMITAVAAYSVAIIFF